MKARKTVPVEDVKTLANKMLANSADEVTQGREAIAVMLEHILMDTGNYHGFRYLPGVMDFSTDPPSVVGDETRRAYY